MSGTAAWESAVAASLVGATSSSQDGHPSHVGHAVGLCRCVAAGGGDLVIEHANLAHGSGQGHDVVGFVLIGGAVDTGKTNEFPPLGDREFTTVFAAQVVAARMLLRGQRAQDLSLIHI